MSSKLTYLNFEEAVKRSLDLVENTSLCELIPLGATIGRVLAKDVVCVKNLPSFNNSAMDGFAIKGKDSGKTLNIKRVIFAGDKCENITANLNEGECYKIMTGAQVPSDADTILPIENCFDVTDEMVRVSENVKLGSNLRLKGEEQKEGTVLLKKGEVINSACVALLATQGLNMIEVYKELNIAVVSTGNEIKEPWEKADEEEIYNCNSYALVTLLNEKGFKATYSGVIPDSLEASISFIENLKNYDVIITTGGISMGDADFVGEAFLKNGLQTAFHGVNVKPGRPIMMGTMHKSIVMCLPGNPLTAMVNMHLFAIPVLNKLQGSSCFFHDVSLGVNQEEFKTKAGRVNVVLGTLKNGSFKVTRNNKYGSGMITALYESNALLVTNEQTGHINVNQEVKVIKFSNKLLDSKIDIFN